MVRYGGGSYVPSYSTYVPNYSSGHNTNYSSNYYSTTYGTPSSSSYLGSIGSSLYAGSSSLLSTLSSLTHLNLGLRSTPTPAVRSRPSSSGYDQPSLSYRSIPSYDPPFRTSNYETPTTSYQRSYDTPTTNYRNYLSPNTYYTPTARVEKPPEKPQKPISLDTTDIDVTTKKDLKNKPGEVKGELTYGTIRRNRQVVRLTTKRLPDVSELDRSEEEKKKNEIAYQEALKKMPSPKKDPVDVPSKLVESQEPVKKTKAQKLVEKYLIPSVKKATQKRAVLKYGQRKSTDVEENNPILERKPTLKAIAVRRDGGLTKQLLKNEAKALVAAEVKVTAASTVSVVKTNAEVPAPATVTKAAPVLNEPVVLKKKDGTVKAREKGTVKRLVRLQTVEKAAAADQKQEVCNVNCHHKCEKHMPNLCGVNQKLLAEALSSVKRGSKRSPSPFDDATPTGSSATSRRSSTKSSLSSTSESDEDSSTEVESEEEIARPLTEPPAKNRPKFRKYGADDFVFLKVLGKGSFGKVMLAELKNTESYYAVKCLKKDVVLEDDDVECTLIERKVLALGTKHPYLCHLFCTFQTESHLFFVMEYLNGGDLMFHIQQSGKFSEDRSRFYAAEIVSGLKFLHNKGIMYRDLKLDNILLDYEGHVRIADFGMCKLQIYLDRTADTFCGTPDYMAPEIIKGLKYNQCVDWWSFGVLVYEMLVGQSPFNGCDEDELFYNICNEKVPYPKYLSIEAISVMTLLMEKDSTKRLGTPTCTAGDICDHIFFKGIDWKKLDRNEIEPPYKPKVKHVLDTQYFDPGFTAAKPQLTPVDKDILVSMDQAQFKGFSYTNPNTTD